MNNKGKLETEQKPKGEGKKNIVEEFEEKEKFDIWKLLEDEDFLRALKEKLDGI
jgi:hypothetical protein